MSFSLEARDSVDAVYTALLARAPENKMEPRLEPMRRLLHLLGDPQQSAPVLHLTGTNGKTSTARLIEVLLRGHNLRTGLYTSPHLNSVTERIVLDGDNVAEATFVRIWNEIAPFVAIIDRELLREDQPRLTYFETLTALAFAIFSDTPVDVVVLEVGLGGITDATNVADGAVSIITPIALDHTDLLGTNLEGIAREKTGILKPEGFLISAAQDTGVAQVLIERSRALEIPFRFEGIAFGVIERRMAVGGQMVTLQGLAGRYADLSLPLHGEHQAQNAVVALAAVEVFLGNGQRALDTAIVEQAFSSVTSPGRLEVLSTSPTIVVDAAHNPAGIAVSCAALLEDFPCDPLVVIFGALREKNIMDMLTTLRDTLQERLGAICFVQSSSPRAVEAQELVELALELGYREDQVQRGNSIPEALIWGSAFLETRAECSGTILVTGSITVVGETRAWIRENIK